MRYAKVVFGLPVEGPFDYIIPESLRKKLTPGSRAIVFFGNTKKIGYLVGVSRQTKIKNLKSVIAAPDEIPVLNKNMLLAAKKLAEYYSCSSGEAIETMLPQDLRVGRPVHLIAGPLPKNAPGKLKTIILHAEKDERWKNFYLTRIKDALRSGEKVIILLPDSKAVPAIEKLIRNNFANPAAVLIRNHPGELKQWAEIKEGRVDIVIGTRSAVFTPLERAGLIIIDEENSYGYKQDQVPHYHCRQAALLRASIDKATLILGSQTPSLEAIYAAKKGKTEYIRLPRTEKYPEIKTIDTKRLPLFSLKKPLILSRYLEDSIAQALANKEKILLFLNRLGFATSVTCMSCGANVKCPRCSINLVLHYKEDSLVCHYCNFKMAPPKLCPACNAGYLQYKGAGTEKIESELSRIFPQAKVKELDIRKDRDIAAADIFIASQSIAKESGMHFGLIGVLSIDNTINRADFRSSEKAFAILSSLCGLSNKKVIIQTGLPNNHIFDSLINDNPGIFYTKELTQRKELMFPPFRHFAILKLRGKIADRVETTGKALFAALSAANNKDTQALSFNPGSPAKLRGNYYWQILLRAKSAPAIGKFLKTHLHGMKHSGIIVTVDVDPI